MLVALCFEKAKTEEASPASIYFTHVFSALLGLAVGIFVATSPPPSSNNIKSIAIFASIVLTATLGQESYTQESCSNLNNVELEEFNNTLIGETAELIPIH